MKKYLSKHLIWLFAFVLVVLFILFPGCGREDEAAQRAAEFRADMLKLLPDNVTALAQINLRKFTQIPRFDHFWAAGKGEESAAAAEPRSLESIQSLLAVLSQIGIDAKTQLYAVTLAVTGEIKLPTPENLGIVGILHADFDPGKLNDGLKALVPALTDHMYNGVSLLAAPLEENNLNAPWTMAHIGGHYIIGGVKAGVEKIIDRFRAKTGTANPDNNTQLRKYIQRLKGDALFSFAWVFPDYLKTEINIGMLKLDFSRTEALYGSIDYVDKTWRIELELVSRNVEVNELLAATLNSFKLVAGGGGPDLEKAVKNLDIFATADSVRLQLSLSDELLDKLQQTAETYKGKIW